jgi:hypothetical protein
VAGIRRPGKDWKMMGFGGLWMLLIVVVTLLAIAALAKYLMK